MAWKCYRKLSPENSPILSNGSKVVFATVDHNVGYYATENEDVQRQLAQFMAESRYGLTEIPPEEFHQFLDKKKALGAKPLKPLWREEIAPRQFSSDTVSPTVPRNGVAAVADRVMPMPLPSNPIPTIVPVAASDDADGVRALPPAAGPVVTDYKPPTAKRAKIKPPAKK